MTRPNALVLDGGQIKARLEAERMQSGVPVHVDWCRFTCTLKNAPAPSVDDLFPAKSWSMLDIDYDNIKDRQRKLTQILQTLDDPDFSASAQAKQLATDVCTILGPDFFIEPELKKGHDFYRFRWSIVRGGAEVGWVGFLSSGDSPRQQAQSKTIHCNLYGAACTFAQLGWRESLADYMDQVGAKVTRVDLALDFFNGITGGLDRIRADWHSDLMNVYGKRPKANTVGPWVDGGRGRSFYFGSKEAGKQTNVYEKGVQLFGEKDATNWERVELRYGNKLRELSTDMLRRPADFFAGASDWHLSILQEHCLTEVSPEPIPTKSRAAEEIVSAEVVKVYRWLKETAGPAIGFAFKHLKETQLEEIFFNQKLPGRLQRFTSLDLAEGVQKAFNHFTAPRHRAPGPVAALAH